LTRILQIGQLNLERIVGFMQFRCKEQSLARIHLLGRQLDALSNSGRGSVEAFMKTKVAQIARASTQPGSEILFDQS